MTDPLQSQDLEKQYEAELQELESLPPAEVELTAKQVIALVTHIQIASRSRDPGVALNPLLPRAIEGAKQIQSYFHPESATYQVLEFGWQEQGSGEDVPHQIFTTHIPQVRSRDQVFLKDEQY